MSKVFEYRCRGCGLVFETDKIRAPHARHMSNRDVCGTLIRVWGSTNFNHVPGGRP